MWAKSTTTALKYSSFVKFIIITLWYTSFIFAEQLLEYNGQSSTVVYRIKTSYIVTCDIVSATNSKLFVIRLRYWLLHCTCVAVTVFTLKQIHIYWTNFITRGHCEEVQASLKTKQTDQKKARTQSPVQSSVQTPCCLVSIFIFLLLSCMLYINKDRGKISNLIREQIEAAAHRKKDNHHNVIICDYRSEEDKQVHKYTNTI